MYTGMDAICVRDHKMLMINDLPSDITQDDLFEEFCRFGEIEDIELNPQWGNAALHFKILRAAANAEKYLIMASSAGQPGQPMMPQMMSPMSAMMGVPMMGQLGMMGPTQASMHPWTARPMAFNQQPLVQRSPPPTNIRITAQSDGSRNIFSPPKNVNIQGGDSGLVNPVDNVEGPHALEVGKCTLCLKRTSYTCGRCGAFYCSRECQKQNWPDHIALCNDGLPPLNFAGKMSKTEVEIHGMVFRGPDGRSQWRQRQENQRGTVADDAEHRGRRSPAFKSNDTAEAERHPKQHQSSNDRMHPRSGNENVHASNFKESNGRSERQASGFQRDCNRVDGHEQRSDERPNRVPSTSLGQQQGQGRFGAGQPQNNSNREGLLGRRPGDRQGTMNSGRTNFNGNQEKSSYSRTKNENENGALSKLANDCMGDRIRQSRSNSQDSPNSANLKELSTENEAKTPDAPVAQAVGNEDPKKPLTGTMARLISNLKVVSKEEESSTECGRPNLPDSGSPAPAVSSPAPRVGKPPNAVIANGSKVVLSHFEDNVIYIRSCEPNHLEQLVELTCKLSKYCGTARSLDRQPKKKEFLAAKFSADQTFYRAVVERKPNKTDDKYEVRFVDFGNPECGVTNAEMKLLPDDLAEVPCMAVLTTLKDIPEKPLSTEAMKLLKQYFEQDVNFTVEFSNSISEGVKLRHADGESVNDKILKLMGTVKSPLVSAAATPVAPVVSAPTPSLAQATAPMAVQTPAPAPVVIPAAAPVVVPPPASAPVVIPAAAPVVVPPPASAPVVIPAAAPVVVPPPASVPCVLTMDDIKYVEFPPVGSRLKILINHVHRELGFLMACPVDETAIKEAGALTPKLQIYANTAQPHRPSDNELCVAKWTDDCWYRGVCLGPRGNDSYTIMFLEYGNIDDVNYPDIRPITKELIQMPALSSMCLLHGMELNDVQKERLHSMHRDSWVVEATVMKFEEGTYHIAVPEITSALQ